MADCRLEKVAGKHHTFFTKRSWFILTPRGWLLSPAFDINPSIDNDQLALNIDMDNNALNLELAQRVGVYFRLSEKDMKRIIDEVSSSVIEWKKIAGAFMHAKP